ncbi:MAG: ATP-dependent zinc metalloprotease FtsH, partial [Phycisphaerales bacterium]|nr:ATP-dependent zinc metalloprotease FtsH [Phycisphaerales bacterium]
ATLILLTLLLFVWMQAQAVQVQSLGSWAEFVTLYENGDIVENTIVVGDSAVTAERRAPGGATQKVQFRIRRNATEFYLAELNNLTQGRFRDAGGAPMWIRILFSPLTLTVFFIALIWVFILRGLRNVGSGGGMLGNFGKSRHRVLAKETTGVTFADVAGVEEAKEELREIIEFLRNPKKFTRLGGRVPRGVLLVGEPGCGKTLLAKAIAGEADVPFFSISGSDFVEMFVGVGASRVRDLFKQAKESSPCIIFLDEIDAVGRRRGGGFTTGGHDEREQTLNAILVEMDGFDSSDQIIVIAATNRVDVLDPALLRPGRFDRQVVVPLPDLKGRLEILQVHAKKIKMSPDVDLARLARGTPMFSGADLAAIINEAAIAATMHEKEHVEQDDLEEARDKVKYGRSRRSHAIEEDERIATAYHEAGHAVLQAVIPGADPLHKVTIIPRGQALGATFSIPEKDRHGVGLKWLRATMRVVCGGRIAELRKTGDSSSGASMDIQQLTTMARAAVLEWGMSDRLGFVRYAGTDSRDVYMREREFSEDTARLIDEEIRRFADESYRDAEQILNERWDAVVRIAEALLKYETLSADEVQRLIRGEELTRQSVSDLLAAEARKSRPAAPERPARRASDDGKDAGPGLLPSPA